MAKKNDFTFESERYVRRQQLRRYLIPAAAVAGLILLAVVIGLIVRANKKERIVSGEGADYAYTWTIDRKGVVTLSLDRTGVQDSAWVVTSPSENLEGAVMSISEGTQGKKSTSFTLTPQLTGLFPFTVELVRGGDPNDSVYRYDFTAEVTQGREVLRAVPGSVSGEAFSGMMAGGDDTDYPYSLNFAAGNVLEIHIRMPGGGSWGTYAEPVTEAGGQDTEAGTAEETTEGEGTEASAEEETAAPAGDEPEAPAFDREEFEKFFPGISSLSSADAASLESWWAEHRDAIIRLKEAEQQRGTDVEEPASPAEPDTETEPEGSGSQAVPEYNPDPGPEDMPMTTEPSGDIWIVSSSDEDVAMAVGPFPEEDGAMAYVRPGIKAGTCTLRLWNPEKGVELSVEYKLGEDGKAEVLSHELKTGGGN